MMQFTPPEIWKWHHVLLDIHARNYNIKIAECLDVNLRTVQRIQKELDESNGDNKGIVTGKSH